MFSIGKTDPRLYKRTLASAGMSCVVVTSTFTQLLLQDTVRHRLNHVLINEDEDQQRIKKKGSKVAPGADDGQGLERVGEPGVSQSLHLRSELEPGVSFSWAQ